MVIEKADKLSYALWSMENSPDGVFWTDPGGNILYVNRALCTETGFSEGELLSMNVLDLDPMVREADLGMDGRLAFPVRSGDIARLSSVYRHKDDHLIPVEVTMSVPRDDGLVIVCFIRDVSEERKYAAECNELAKEASTDFLTGTWLRRYFFQVAQHSIYEAESSGKPLSLLMFDIDNFKEVNDTFGHNVGDAALVEFCNVVSGSVRDNDYFVRWGGDEFVLLMPDVDLEGAVSLGERLRKLVATHHFSDSPALTMSGGTAQYRPGKNDIGSWVADADAALLRAKKSGGNRVKKAH